MTDLQIPFLDLKAHHAAISNDIVDAIRAVIDKNAFVSGSFTETFEIDFAAYCGCEHAIGVGSGTEALWLSLLAAGIGTGDEVITVPNTFIATAEAISFAGATPVFVDVDPGSYNMDPALIESAITTRTRAIIPVHLYGQPADMDPILAIAKTWNLVVIEDACQAHGATYKGHKAGSMGHAGCFSFYPGKNLGAFGDAGAVVTNDAQLSEQIKMLRDHGQTQKYNHHAIGWNARMDGIQGAVLKEKLRYLDEWNHKRRVVAQWYRQALEDVVDVQLPQESENTEHVYHVYAIQSACRDALMADLKSAGVVCGIHYPIPIHLQKAYQKMELGHGAFPASEYLCQRTLSLPMFPEMTRDQTQSIAKAINRFYTKQRNY